MTKNYGLFINGRERPATGKETFAVLNPMTETVYGYAAKGGQEDVNAAVLSAQAAFPAWARLAPADRERIMLRAADLLEANGESLANIVVDESGSTIRKARGEVSYGASLIRAAAGEVRRLYGDTFPNDKPERLSIVIREPMGVVAAISPFNAPLVLLIKMVVFALAAGNAVIAKPSEETPLIAIELAKIFHDAGMMSGVFNVITGYGPETGAALVDHPGLNAIAFTGSTATGIQITRTAASHMHRLQMELGGKNPLIVLADVDIDETVDIAAIGAFTHAGQICMSSARILVEQSIARRFAVALARKAESLYLGDLRDERTEYGPLINRRAFEKVQTQVDTAVAAGADLLAGGAVHNGLVYKPTVLWEPPRDSAVWCEETFGPVATVTAVRDLDEAIAQANETNYGLSAGILTNDMQRGLQAARQIKAGSVHIGMHSFQSDAMAPIGGYGMSGFGRSGGKYAVEHFTELKWISFEVGAG